MKKLLLTSIIAISFATPSMADIAANANSATCNSGTLNTASGTSNLTAQWTPNTINITWDNNNATSGGTGGDTSCSYSSTFDIPSTPSRTGYTFGGWALKAGGSAAAPAQCSLSGLNANTGGIDFASLSLNNSYCYYYNDSTGDEIEDDCSDNVFSGLRAGEWKTNFSYGTIKGVAKCSGKSGDSHSQQWGGASSDWSATESELNSANGEAKYCWCKPTTYTANGSSACPVSASSWVFDFAYDNAEDCEDICANDCAGRVPYASPFRVALFGLSN